MALFLNVPSASPGKKPDDVQEKELVKEPVKEPEKEDVAIEKSKEK